MKIKNKLQELKNEYPELNLKALVIKNNDLNFAFTLRNYFRVSTIESNDYQGILYQRITQERTAQNKYPALVIEMVVDIEEFESSSNRSFYLIKEYGI